jgi:hypothetical protein
MKIMIKKLNNNLKLTLQIGSIINIALYIFDKYFIVPAWIIFPFLQNRLFSWCRNKKSIIGCRLERNGWIFVFVFVYLLIFLIVYIINKLKSRKNDE